eukprot:scaffold4423_cov105-Isochrysis_galbana.AAC.13
MARRPGLDEPVGRRCSPARRAQKRIMHVARIVDSGAGGNRGFSLGSTHHCVLLCCVCVPDSGSMACSARPDDWQFN